MRDLLKRIPRPDGQADAWNGVPLPPRYVAISAEPADAWFVDGGNAAILEAPHFSLQQLRAVGVHYPKKVIIRKDIKVLLVREPEGWLAYDENSVTTRIAEDELQEVVTRVRQQLEHGIANECLAQNNGIVVLDGDIAPAGCLALQKSVTTLTTRGFPLSAVLTATGPWSTQLGEVYAVKLDKRARHVFLVHGVTDTKQLRVLAHYSHDAIFPGYPGGLVLADRLARVSNEERESLRIHARSMLKGLREHVAAAEAAADSHTILDSM